MRVQPYLCFEGACEEALAFYGKAIGAKVTFSMRNKETPDPAMCRPGTEEKIMHAEFQVGDSALMASDGMCTGKPNSRASRSIWSRKRMPRRNACSMRLARRQGGDAAGQDLLLLQLRHGDGPLRCRLDDLRAAADVTAT